MGNIFSNIGGALTDPLGTGAVNSANSANSDRYRQALGQSHTLEGLLGQQYGVAGGYLQNALKSINTGYSGARASLGTAGQTAKTDILRQGDQQLAGAQQSLTSRGLYNTTAFDAASRGIHADTSRAFSTVDENIASMLANLQVGEGQAQAGAYGALSGLAQGQYGAQANLYQNRINTISSRNDVAAPGILASLGSAGGQGGLGSTGAGIASLASLFA